MVWFAGVYVPACVYAGTCVCKCAAYLCHPMYVCVSFDLWIYMCVDGNGVCLCLC